MATRNESTSWDERFSIGAVEQATRSATGLFWAPDVLRGLFGGRKGTTQEGNGRIPTTRGGELWELWSKRGNCENRTDPGQGGSRERVERARNRTEHRCAGQQGGFVRAGRGFWSGRGRCNGPPQLFSANWSGVAYKEGLALLKWTGREGTRKGKQPATCDPSQARATPVGQCIGARKTI